jgi:hypothetical protein
MMATTRADLKAALMAALTAAWWEMMSVERKEFLSVAP